MLKERKKKKKVVVVLYSLHKKDWKCIKCSELHLLDSTGLFVLIYTSKASGSGELLHSFWRSAASS